MNDIKKLIRELRRVKYQYDLKSITGHKTGIPVNEFEQLIKDLKLDYEIDEGCLFASYKPQQNVFVYLKSEPIEKYPVRIGNEDFDAYDEIAQG